MEKVARFFVVERDPFYIKGKLEGERKGELKARREAKREAEQMKHQFVRNLLESGFTDLAKIASLAEVTKAFVVKVKAELEQSKGI
jgi:hypothetical protein